MELLEDAPVVVLEDHVHDVLPPAKGIRHQQGVQADLSFMVMRGFERGLRA